MREPALRWSWIVMATAMLGAVVLILAQDAARGVEAHAALISSSPANQGKYT